MLDRLKALALTVLTLGGGTRAAGVRKATVAGLSAALSALASAWVATGSLPTHAALVAALGLGFAAALAVWKASNAVA